MISCGSPPAVGTTHTCGVLVFASRFTSTALNKTHFPSGETMGSLIRLSDIMSSKVKGCLLSAEAGRIKAGTISNTITAEQIKMRISFLRRERVSVNHAGSPFVMTQFVRLFLLVLVGFGALHAVQNLGLAERVVGS